MYVNGQFIINNIYERVKRECNETLNTNFVKELRRNLHTLTHFLSFIALCENKIMHIAQLYH